MKSSLFPKKKTALESPIFSAKMHLCAAEFNVTLFIRLSPRDRPYITSAKGLGGWVGGWVGLRKNIDFQYYIYADIAGGCVRKSPEVC